MQLKAIIHHVIHARTRNEVHVRWHYFTYKNCSPSLRLMVHSCDNDVVNVVNKHGPFVFTRHAPCTVRQMKLYYDLLVCVHLHNALFTFSCLVDGCCSARALPSFSQVSGEFTISPWGLQWVHVGTSLHQYSKSSSRDQDLQSHIITLTVHRLPKTPRFNHFHKIVTLEFKLNVQTKNLVSRTTPDHSYFDCFSDWI